MIKYVKIAETEYPFLFSYSALREATLLEEEETEKKGKPLHDLQRTEILVYSGLKSGYRAASKEFTLNLDDIKYLFDEDIAALQVFSEIVAEEMGNLQASGNRAQRRAAEKASAKTGKGAKASHTAN